MTPHVERTGIDGGCLTVPGTVLPGARRARACRRPPGPITDPGTGITMSASLLFTGHEEAVREDWIDYNGHMNVGHYLLPFENASRAFCRHVDLSREYRERTGHALFAAETHLTFEREVRLGDRLRFSTRVLALAPKWINLIHFMHHAGDGYLAATNQLLFVHVDLRTRRAAPIPPPQSEALETLHRQHSRLPLPAQAGRAITSGIDTAG